MGYLIRGEPGPGRAEGAIEPDPSLPNACVIGAGSCGIAAVKALYEARIPFDCFEAGPVVGGLWKFENPNGLSGAYSTLEMNTSGPRMSYSDFPMNDDDYPPHEPIDQTLPPPWLPWALKQKVTFPFFDEGFISAPDNDLALYRRTFHPDVDGVYFLGLAQPLGAIMPMAEEQAKWIAELIAGRYALPPKDEMLADIMAARLAHERRFYKSKRHTMEVDFDEWMRDAGRERRAGRERAAH